MRTIGYCERCRKFRTVTVPAPHLMLNQLIGVCDDCTTPTPGTRRSPKHSSANQIRHNPTERNP
ncbi:hypothetical protein [Nocardia wallacei]|uniref:hypothetical protein n=1 Tax=Nocardia wallacei TaxID=480035 RepID=UPI00245869C6|nr:hypothetical protein [Nocardia wallacei]